jgi:hypothetical protein
MKIMPWLPADREEIYMGRCRKKNDLGQHFLRRVNPVTREELGFAVAVGGAAASYKMPTPSPTKFGLALTENDGTVMNIRFTDIPLNRGMLAIREHCGGDPSKFFSLAFRLFALGSILRRKEIAPWIRRNVSPGVDEVHPAVIEAAATLPLNSRGHFDARTFFQKVKEVAADGADIVS